MKVGALVNTVVLGGLALGLGLASFAAYAPENGGEAEEWAFSGPVQFGEVLTAEETLTARRNGRDSLVLFAGAQARLDWDESTGRLDVDLLAGEAMFAAEADDFSVSVDAGFAQVDSQSSTAYVGLEDGVLQVYALDHPSLVSFVLGGESINSITVPTDYRMKVSEAKVSETVGRLRLTKLSKEFPVFELDEEDVTPELAAAFAESENAYTESAARALSSVQSNRAYGPPLDGYEADVYRVFGAVRDTLTFVPDAQMRRAEELESSTLQFAMSNLLGSRDAANFWLNKWVAGEHNLENVRDLYASMHAVLPGDDLYPVKAEAASLLYTGENQLTSLRRRYQEMESLLARGSKVAAEEAYADYQEEFQSALAGGDFDEAARLHELSLEYMLLERLLRANAVFYSPDYLATLTDLEDKILELAGSDVDEERQAFVQSKLRFLENLFVLVQERNVSVEDATALADELLASAQTHLGAVRTQVAVTKFFASEIENYEVAVQYINAPEFYSYTDFDEGLAAYQAKVGDLRELNDYIQNLRAGEVEDVTEITLEEAVSEASIALLRNGVQYADLESLGDTEYRLFEVKGGRTAGYAFEGKYDRESQIFYDVVVEDVRFSAGLLLENLRDVIAEVVGELGEEVEEEEELVEELTEDSPSLTEAVALQTVEEDFAELELEDFEFTVLDLEENLFHFSGKIGKFGIPVAGEYSSETGKVSEVIWLFGDEERSIPSVNLSALETLVVKTYEGLLE